MDTLIWIVAAVVVFVLVTLFILLRKFGLERLMGTGKKEVESPVPADVEFEWTARPPLVCTLIVALVVIARIPSTSLRRRPLSLLEPDSR